jgi:hypothetical protein
MDFILNALKDRQIELIEKYMGGGSGRRRKSQAKVIENAFERQKTLKEAVRQIPMSGGMLDDDMDGSDRENYGEDDNEIIGKYSEKDIKEILYPKDNFQIYLSS